MFFYISILLALFTTLFIKLDGHTIVYTTFNDKFTRFQKLTSLVATQKKNIFNILLVSLSLIFKALYLSFLQKANKSIQKLDGDKYEISYLVNGKLYKLILNCHRGPSPILEVRDENDDDVTDDVVSYCGIDMNLTQLSTLTPAFFNKTKLTFEMANGEEFYFSEHQLISFENGNV